MALVTLVDPIAGTVTDASLIASNNAAIVAALNGGLDNTNISTSAAIGYSKLALGNSIVNSDIATAAAIAISKLAAYPADNTKFLRGDGTWSVPGAATGAFITHDTLSTGDVTINTSSEGAANTIKTTTSKTYTANPVLITFFCSRATCDNALGLMRFVLLRDATVIVGVWGAFSPKVANAVQAGINLIYRETPSAGAHTYTVKAYVSGGGNGQVGAEAGGSGNQAPAFIRTAYDL